VLLSIQNLINRDKIEENIEIILAVLMTCYEILRDLGNSEAMPVKHWVRGSRPCWGNPTNQRVTDLQSENPFSCSPRIPHTQDGNPVESR
jgi:hypothetical protein